MNQVAGRSGEKGRRRLGQSGGTVLRRGFFIGSAYQTEADEEGGMDAQWVLRRVGGQPWSSGEGKAQW